MHLTSAINKQQPMILVASTEMLSLRCRHFFMLGSVRSYDAVYAKSARFLFCYIYFVQGYYLNFAVKWQVQRSYFSLGISIGKRFRQSEAYREKTNKATEKQFNLVNKYSYCKTLLVDGIIQVLPIKSQSSSLNDRRFHED